MKRKKSAKEVEPNEQLLSSANHCDRVRQTDYLSPIGEHERSQIGIYGWRKKFLYILIIVIAALVFINAALTLWIITALNFSMFGLGSLKITSEGINVTGNAFISDQLFATEINSRKGQPLRIHSDENVTLYAINGDGDVVNRIFIDKSKLTAITNGFAVRGQKGQLLFEVNDQRVTIATDTLNVDNVGGIRFKSSLQTPLIQASAYDELKLISPQNRIQLNAPISIAMESRFGDISAACLRNLRLKSSSGKIILETSDLQLRNLKTAIPVIPKANSKAANAYQLCICADSGKLFLAHSDQPCAANETICLTKHRFKTVVSYVPQV